MNHNKLFAPIIGLVIILAACSTPTAVLPDEPKANTTPVATKPQATTETKQAAPETEGPTHTTAAPQTENQAEQEPVSFPLSEPGPYFAGTREVVIVDESRAGREIKLTIWYPAVEQFDADGKPVVADAQPDMSEAPYPLILTGRHSGEFLFKSHLATHGFVTATVRSPKFSYLQKWDMNVIDGPLDFLYALDQLASLPPEGLAGLIDTDRAGAAGYSWDGFFSLALGGVRIDPAHYLSQCAQAPSLEPPLSSTMLTYYCSLAGKWDQLEAYASPTMTTSEDGLWQPLTDDRILAVMPMAPDGAWLYGERGLAAVDIPTFILVGTEDTLYDIDASYIYEHLGTAEKYLVSYIDKGHMLVDYAEPKRRINHFAAAYFGYYLQERDEYGAYFSEDFVAQFDDLYWGVYPDQ